MSMSYHEAPPTSAPRIRPLRREQPDAAAERRVAGPDCGVERVEQHAANRRTARVERVVVAQALADRRDVARHPCGPGSPRRRRRQGPGCVSIARMDSFSGTSSCSSIDSTAGSNRWSPINSAKRRSMKRPRGQHRDAVFEVPFGVVAEVHRGACAAAPRSMTAAHGLGLVAEDDFEGRDARGCGGRESAQDEWLAENWLTAASIDVCRSGIGLHSRRRARRLLHGDRRSSSHDYPRVPFRLQERDLLCAPDAPMSGLGNPGHECWTPRVRR